MVHLLGPPQIIVEQVVVQQVRVALVEMEGMPLLLVLTGKVLGAEVLAQH
jgi:hypothetical protein